MKLDELIQQLNDYKKLGYGDRRVVVCDVYQFDIINVDESIEDSGISDETVVSVNFRRD